METVDLRSDLRATLQSVIDELEGRLRGELSEPDETAITTAVHKALYRGLRLGANAVQVAYQDQFNELDVRVDGKPIYISPLKIVDDEDAEVDLWLERYGDEEEDA